MPKNFKPVRRLKNTETGAIFTWTAVLAAKTNFVEVYDDGEVAALPSDPETFTAPASEPEPEIKPESVTAPVPPAAAPAVSDTAKKLRAELRKMPEEALRGRAAGEFGMSFPPDAKPADIIDQIVKQVG